MQAAMLFAIAFICLWIFIGGRLLYSTLLWVAAAGGSVFLAKGLYSAGLVVHPLWLPL